MNLPILIRGMYGLGDTLYMRAVVRERIRQSSDQLYIQTPWPQIWQDLPVKMIRSGTTLRMQKRNEEANTHLYHPPPFQSRYRRNTYVGYGGHDFKDGSSMLDTIGQSLATNLPDSMSVGWTVPDDWKWRPTHDDAAINARPIAFVRPPTLRKEWMAPGRNPDQAAFEACVNHLMESHHVVSVASIEVGKEWLIGNAIGHTFYHDGQLSFEQMLGLLAAADFAFGGVGWLVPAMQCVKTRAAILFGGVLGANGRHVIMPDQLDWQNVRMILPDDGEQCWCISYRHACRKKTDPTRAVDELKSFLAIPHREHAAA